MDATFGLIQSQCPWTFDIFLKTSNGRMRDVTAVRVDTRMEVYQFGYDRRDNRVQLPLNGRDVSLPSGQALLIRCSGIVQYDQNGSVWLDNILALDRPLIREEAGDLWCILVCDLLRRCKILVATNSMHF
jgi:hypothetical protein